MRGHKGVWKQAPGYNSAAEQSLTERGWPAAWREETPTSPLPKLCPHVTGEAGTTKV